MNRSCNQCGKALPEGVAGQRCPVCLLAMALDDSDDQFQSTPSVSSPAGQQIGGYDLIEEIARGGMGLVYKARQIRLNRIVALKLILSGQFASKQEVLRFRAEAEAAANLRHPNIVAVYETGEDEGRHYFSMEFVAGRDLAAIVRDSPLPAKRAARYCEAIARAIHYAHLQGTLHRDLKPSNVLIDATDEVRITDFGLAKRLRGDFGLTVTGQVLGSPNFMPPEQTSGRSIAFGPAGDVYGIGAILYHLLTARPPFQAGSIEEVLRQLHEQEPVPPRLLLPDIPQDLETICLKCLEKDPAKRYFIADELADELGRFLRDETIRARPASRIEKVWRWCRRKPVVAGLFAALGLAILLGTGGVFWEWQRAAASATALRHGLYAADINLAWHVRTEKDINRAANLLRRHVPKSGEKDLRGFEWRYLSAMCQGMENYSVLAHDAEVTSVAVTPDGQFFLTTGNDRTAKLWNLKTREFQATLKHLAGNPSLHSLAVSADGKRVAVCDTVAVTVWNSTNWSELKTLTEPAIAIEFSPQTGALATSSGNGIKIWDAASWIPRTIVQGPLELFAFSPDGRTLAVARGEALELHDAVTGRLTTTLPEKIQDHAYALAFTPDGQFLAVGGMYGEVKVWNISNSLAVAKFTPHTSFVSGLAFSPDGQWGATGGSDQYLTLGKVAGWHKEAELYGHTNGIWSLTFTPDSQYLMSASRDRTVKFWKIPPETRIDLLGEAQTLIGFLPDSQTAVTLNADGTLGFWDVATLRETNRVMINAQAPATAGAASRDGTMVAVGFKDGTVAVRDLAQGELWRRASGGTNAIFSLLFAPDGKSLVSTDVALSGAPTTNGKLVVWDVASGEHLTALTELLGGQGGAVAFSHDGRVLAIGKPDNSILLWDRAGNRALHSLKGHTWNIASLAFSPDDRTLASASWDTSVRLWDVATGYENARLPGLPIGAGAVCFSPDGRTLAATFGYNSVQLWQVWDLHELLSFQWSGRFIGQLQFSPDGTTLGAGRVLPISPDGGVQLWRAPGLSPR